MSSFWTLIIFLSFTFFSSYLSEAKHHKKLPSAIVVGTVYCHTCFLQNLPHANHFISGASVEVQCNETRSRRGFRQQVKTNSYGEFKVNLPFPVRKHDKKIRGCSVRLIRSNEPYCAVAAAATSSSYHLKSREEGAHIFSAGFFSFKPLEQPQVCDQKPNFKNSDEKELSGDPNSKKEIDQLPFPPNPLNPPSIFPPNPFQPPPSILPPNPFQPPPSIFPPIFPSPPPSIFPPILPTPPTPPFFNLPPLPGLIPTPPPPPPPALPIPLPPFLPPFPFQPTPGFPGVPPFPFQPTPGFPGVPPAKVSSQSRTSSP